MIKGVILKLIIGLSVLVSFSREFEKDSNREQIDLLFYGDQTHKNWCSIQFWWKLRWCQTKSYLGGIKNATLTKEAVKECNDTYAKELSTCSPRVLGLSNEVSDHHLNTCEVKVKAIYYWCNTKSFFTRNATQKAIDQKACKTVYEKDLSRCPRNLNRLFGDFEQKHKSHCLETLFQELSDCKGQSAVYPFQRVQQLYQRCDEKYSPLIAKCETDSLVTRMLKRINPHKSKIMCEYKNKFRSIRCAKMAYLEKDPVLKAEKANKCKADLNAANTLCLNARISKTLADAS